MIWLGGLALVLGSGSVWAHGIEPHRAELWRWNADPAVLVPLLTVTLAYSVGLTRLWQRAGRGRGVALWRVVAFCAGLLLLASALLSPLEAFSQVSFAAHMIQHTVLMLLAPPLLILGKPLAPFILALPMAWRGILGHWLAAGWPGRAGRFLTSAPIAVTLYGAALWIWHVPSAYQAALADEGVHNAEHLSLLGAALAFWWSVIYCGRSGRFGYGSGIVMLFVTAMHSKLLGILLNLAPAPLYPVYAAAVSPWGLSALEDQQLAGLIMLLPCEVVYLSVALGLLGVWLAGAGRVRRLSG